MKHRTWWGSMFATALLSLGLGFAAWAPAQTQDDTGLRLTALEARVTLLEATVAAYAVPAELAATPVPETFVIEGTFELDGIRGDDFSILNSGCYGDGGYDDIYPGAEVRVRDGSGAILAVSELESASSTRDCLFEFELEVPRADFYEVSAGHANRGGITYAFEELVEEDWVVGLYLG